MRDVLSRIFLEKDIHQRLDFSREFFNQFNMRNKAVRK